MNGILLKVFVFPPRADPVDRAKFGRFYGVKLSFLKNFREEPLQKIRADQGSLYHIASITEMSVKSIAPRFCEKLRCPDDDYDAIDLIDRAFAKGLRERDIKLVLDFKQWQTPREEWMDEMNSQSQ